MVAHASFFSAQRIAVALWLGLAACTKSEASGAAANTEATLETKANLTPPAASVASSAVPALPTEAAPKANPKAPECGVKPLPDCPLQAWMKANTSAQMVSNDFPALARALDKTATFAPAVYTNWASISKDGAAAARSNDMSATKAACRSCHEQYKERYKKELRAQRF